MMGTEFNHRSGLTWVPKYRNTHTQHKDPAPSFNNSQQIKFPFVTLSFSDRRPDSGWRWVSTFPDWTNQSANLISAPVCETSAEMRLSCHQAGLLDEISDRQIDWEEEAEEKKGSVARNKLLGLHNKDRFLKTLL